jgi:hypothetical protein
MIALNDAASQIENNDFIFTICDNICLLQLAESFAYVSSNNIQHVFGTGI